MKQKELSGIPVSILGVCPECGSYRIGLVRVSDCGKGADARWLRQAEKLYQEHRHLLRFVPYYEYEEGFSANRFCGSCGFEWREEGRVRYQTMELSEEEFDVFWEETEFSFDQFKRKETEGKRKNRAKGIWNSLFGRIWKL